MLWLQRLICVDAARRMDFVYSEIDEAAGEDEEWFDAAEFEENMSTHYGRIVHEDDQTMMFANPEDAAEYLGFRPGYHQLKFSLQRVVRREGVQTRSSSESDNRGPHHSPWATCR